MLGNAVKVLFGYLKQFFWDKLKIAFHYNFSEIMFNNNQHMQQPQPHPQIFLPPRAPHQLIQKVGGQPIGISTNLKRTSSPIPISNNYYKQSSSQPQQSIYLPPKLELEGRRADNRAVLWNSKFSNVYLNIFYLKQ